MEQKAQWTSIGDAWRAIEGLVGWEAINAAMAGVFSFEKNYKDFAVQAFNYRLNPGDPAAPEMQVPDAKFPPYLPELALSRTDDKKQVTFGRVSLEGGGVTVQVKVPALAMRYHVFGVADNVKKLEVDFTGVQPSQAMDVEALLHIQTKGWERRALSDGKTTFCRDRPAENVDGAILVIANHSWAAAEILTGSYKLLPSDKPCEENKDLHLGGLITWNASSPGRFGYPENTSGSAHVVLHVVTHSLLVAERDEQNDHSTYKYEYSSDDERCSSSSESGTLESGGGVGEVGATDYSIGTLNVSGDGLWHDLYLYINMRDYCGPSRGGDLGTDYFGFQGFPSCETGPYPIIARFDGTDSYIIECNVTNWDNVEASGHISGILKMLDGPHPTPPS
jgi:hypothetical protein